MVFGGARGSSLRRVLHFARKGIMISFDRLREGTHAMRSLQKRNARFYIAREGMPPTKDVGTGFPTKAYFGLVEYLS